MGMETQWDRESIWVAEVNVKWEGFPALSEELQLSNSGLQRLHTTTAVMDATLCRKITKLAAAAETTW